VKATSEAKTPPELVIRRGSGMQGYAMTRGINLGAASVRPRAGSRTKAAVLTERKLFREPHDFMSESKPDITLVGSDFRF
jgi:hypothetical protein